MIGASDDVRMIVKANADFVGRHNSIDYKFEKGKEYDIPWLAGDHVIGNQPGKLSKIDEFKMPQTEGGPKLDIVVTGDVITMGQPREIPKPKEVEKLDSPDKEPDEEQKEEKKPELTPKEEIPVEVKKESLQPRIKLPINFDNYKIKELRKFALKYGLKAKDTDTDELREQIKKELGY